MPAAPELGWPLPEGSSDKIPRVRRPQPDWAYIHRALRKPNVTLSPLWEEYRAAWPEGYGYNRFCD